MESKPSIDLTNLPPRLAEILTRDRLRWVQDTTVITFKLILDGKEMMIRVEDEEGYGASLKVNLAQRKIGSRDTLPITMKEKRYFQRKLRGLIGVEESQTKETPGVQSGTLVEV